MTSNASHAAGPLELRAAEFEAAVVRTAERFTEVPVVETSMLRLLTLMGRESSALLEELLRPHGLNETDFRILMCLYTQPDGVGPGRMRPVTPPAWCRRAGSTPELDEVLRFSP